MLKKILLIGSIPYRNRPNTFGGTTILMKNLLDYLSKSKISFYFISANRMGFKYSFIINYLVVFFKSIFLIPLSKMIMVNCSRNGAFYLYPLVFLVSKLLNKKIIFRMFGGNFIDLFEQSNFFKKNILLFCLRYTDIICVETKYIINYLNKILIKKDNFFWLPNVRNKADERKSKIYSKKFAFISHIKETKGVDNIIEAASLLPSDYKFDFFGFIYDKKYKNGYINKHKNCNYMGSIEHDKVLDILNDYDIVLLPTFHPGEGYPGIIIESYSIGKPVIATNLKGISEIVVNNRTGILVPVKDTNALYEAIKKIDVNNYMKYSENALKHFDVFDSDIVYPKLFKAIGLI